MKKVALLIVISIIMFGVLFSIWTLHETVVCESLSPDGQYSLVVLKKKVASILPVMPGQGSDAECFVELHEKKSGRMIFRRRVEMLQDIEQVQWAEGKVWTNPHCAISYGGLVRSAVE